MAGDDCIPPAAQDGDLADAVAEPGGEAGGFDIQEGEGEGGEIAYR